MLLIIYHNPATGADENPDIRFMPQWLPQAQFAGYYVAYKNGFFKKYDLNVEIMKGGPDRPSSVYLGNNSADVVTMFLSTAIEIKAGGTEIINIGQMVKKSALMLVSRKSSHINTPDDLENKLLGIWGEDFGIQPLALLNKFKIKARIIPQPGTVNLFLKGGLDVASAMLYNEYHIIINSGINENELNTIRFSDYDLNIPEDGLYVLKSKLDEDPGKFCNFVKASVEGWEYSFNHEDDTIKIVMDYMKSSNIPTNRPHQVWMLNKMRDIMEPEVNNELSVSLDQDEFNNVVSQLYLLDIIDNKPDYSDFFRNCISDA